MVEKYMQNVVEGCCADRPVRTPVKINNRPGLTAIAYRAGTHANFKNTMLARLSDPELPALRGLQTRDDDDFTIALLDAWATVADVLTFYQERIANESYLRTAGERFSLVQLARLIGYEPGPGVAAGTHLAFTLETAQGSPRQVVIETATRVQSTPGQNELPQTFETVEKIIARPEWNAMRPRLKRAQLLSAKTSSIVLSGTATNLKPGDHLLIIAQSGSGSGFEKAFRRVVNVVIDYSAQQTCIELDFIGSITLSGEEGYLPVDNLQLETILPLNETTVKKHILNRKWRASDLEAFTTTQGWPIKDVLLFIAKQKAGAATSATSDTGVFALRTRASLLGHNAPDWNLMPDRTRICYGDTENLSLTDWPFPQNPESHLNLDGVYSQITPNSWVVVKWHDNTKVIARVASVREAGVVNYTISAKVTQIKLKVDKNEKAYPASIKDIRNTIVYGQSEKLPLGQLPVEEPVEGDSIELEGLYDGLRIGQNIILSGKRFDLDGVEASEVAVLKEIILDTGLGVTKLLLNNNLGYSYKREYVTINANVACATHGETVRGVLGSGNAGKPNQFFTLPQSPLTYISAPTPGGVKSTLEVRVNDLLWHEVPTLYGHGSEERIYTTRTADDGKTTIQFGDGICGARLPSGQDNVRATYRRGIGLEGMVRAEQLKLLMTRPLGVKDVNNPIDATGAADRELLNDVRSNATLSVLTLDRIVSLQDYENFARAQAGIAKALATWTWAGEKRVVFVTVAGPEGASIEEGSEVYKNLLKAMKAQGDPSVSLRVQSFKLVMFRIAAAIKINSDYYTEQIVNNVREALIFKFSFHARSFGQPVTLSEVLNVIHSIRGVVAADVDKLYRIDGKGGDGVQQPLPAAAPQAGPEGTFQAAELLVLDSNNIDLWVMS